MKCHEVDYEILGDDMQIVEIELDPGETVLWMLSSSIACNVRLYPHHIRTIFESHGGGFERSGV